MVKQGYKQTEIGVIPEDWEVRKLRETGTFFSTNSLSRDKLSYDNGTIYNIHYGDIHTQFKSHFNIQNELVPFINYAIKPSTINLCKKGDLIIADASENEDDIGKAIEIINDGNKNIVAGLHTLHFRPFNDVFYEGFLGHLWKTELMHLNILKEAQGTKVLGISVSRLLDLQIPLPSLPEQEAIAAALSDADAWIENLEQLIAKKRLIKQGAMQTLLTPKDDWEVKKLGEVCSYRNGKALESYFSKNEGLKVISIGNYSLKSKYIDNGIRISESHINLLNQYVVKKGEFTMIMNDKTSTGEIIGRCLYIDEANKYIINQRSMILAINNSYINDYFFYHLMNSPIIRKIIFKEAKTGTQIYVNTNDVLELKIFFPKSLSEQERIATILSDMDAELEALEQQLAKARQIKQGMMQELLTGRVRLV